MAQFSSACSSTHKFEFYAKSVSGVWLFVWCGGINYNAKRSKAFKVNGISVICIQLRSPSPSFSLRLFYGSFAFDVQTQ